MILFVFWLKFNWFGFTPSLNNNMARFKNRIKLDILEYPMKPNPKMFLLIQGYPWYQGNRTFTTKSGMIGTITKEIKYSFGYIVKLNIILMIN